MKTNISARPKQIPKVDLRSTRCWNQMATYEFIHEAGRFKPTIVIGRRESYALRPTWCPENRKLRFVIRIWLVKRDCLPRVCKAATLTLFWTMPLNCLTTRPCLNDVNQPKWWLLGLRVEFWVPTESRDWLRSSSPRLGFSSSCLGFSFSIHASESGAVRMD